ncbi:putative Glutamate receptor-like 85 [Homarus americanus]|uniref:Putative Glutamate receptor-like 85 n=1 Tax=Homarus americanus TaxID=6706 RepID=A0A8J5JYD4_HOMAM|nr:putative Glutamate receptor-like 85 [Homarus americanus]
MFKIGLPEHDEDYLLDEADMLVELDGAGGAPKLLALCKERRAGLEEIHKKDILHNDVKADNIIVETVCNTTRLTCKYRGKAGKRSPRHLTNNRSLSAFAMRRHESPQTLAMSHNQNLPWITPSVCHESPQTSAMSHLKRLPWVTPSVYHESSKTSARVTLRVCHESLPSSAMDHPNFLPQFPHQTPSSATSHHAATLASSERGCGEGGRGTRQQCSFSLATLEGKEVDMALGPFSITYIRSKVIDFSVPLYIDNFGIFLPRPRQERDLAGFTKPLALEVL